MTALLISLKDIHLTFGGTPLLEGAEIAVAAGDRICLVGRNGSGKSTLMKIAAGLVEADRGERFVHPGARVRYLAQEPDFAGAATTLAYVEGGLGPTDDRHRARMVLETLGLTGEEAPGRLVGRGGAARAAGAGAGAESRRHAAGRANQPSRSAGHRMARSRARGEPGGDRADQP